MDYEDAIAIMRAAGQMHAYHEVGEKPLLAVVDAARRKALEEAAKLCDEFDGLGGEDTRTAKYLARAIRALKEQ